LGRILTAIWRLQDFIPRLEEKAFSKEEEENVKTAEGYEAIFSEKMEDDLNTADAITQIFELVRLANATVEEHSSKAYGEALLQKLETLMAVLGIRTEKKEEELGAKVEALIQQRQDARKNKDFAKADQIRDELLAMGIQLKDTRNGVEWQKI